MNNEALRKNNPALHIPVFTILTGFIILNIHSLITKDATAALWLSGIGLAGVSTLLFFYITALIKESGNENE